MPTIFRYLIYCIQLSRVTSLVGCISIWSLVSGLSVFYPGMAQFVSNFAEPGDLEYAPPIKEAETRVGFSTYYICSLFFFFLWFLIKIRYFLVFLPC